MDKLEALKYFMENYDGPDGVHAFSVIKEIIEEERELYTKEELDRFISECNY